MKFVSALQSCSVPGPSLTFVFDGSRLTGAVQVQASSDSRPSRTPPEPRVTFVTPAFNAAATIDRCLESLVAQSTPDWEAVVVDDGSSDGTHDAVLDWTLRDPRIRLMSQHHAGVSAARNAGLAAARGEFVVFLDADDTVAPTYLERMLSQTNRCGVDAVCCGSNRVSITGKIIERSDAPRLDRNPSELCRKHPPAPLHALMIRRSCVIEAGGFDPRLSAFEDWDLWLRLVGTSLSFAIERQHLASYWRTESSLTSNGREMMRSYQIVATRTSDPGTVLVHNALGPLGPVPTEDVLEAALWNCGLAIGAGRDPAPVLDTVSGPVWLPSGKHALANAFLRGLSIGCQCETAEFIGLWQEFAPAILAFLVRLERHLDVPGAAYALLKATERETIRGDFNGIRVLTRTAGVMISPRIALHGVALPNDVDSVMFRFPGLKAVLETPVWGPLSGREARDILAARGWRRVVQAAKIDMLAPEVMRLVDRPVRSAVRALRGKRRAPVGEAAPAMPRDTPEIHAEQSRQAEIIAEVRADVRDHPIGLKVSPRPFYIGPDFTVATHEERIAAWDDYFKSSPDPWNYASDYEQIKYERTLDIIPAGPVGRALELACAEGRFTQRLAERAQWVRGLDISPAALERAAERCRGMENVEFVASDFFVEPLEGKWDLITCCEVLYYMADVDALQRFAEQVCNALTPGGHFIQAHGYDVACTPGRTGFEWEIPFDGREIAESFRKVKGLKHVRSLDTELYRIDLFTKTEAEVPFLTETASIGASLDYQVEKFVIWNGAITTQAKVERERAYSLPVLMYHRVATESPAELAPYCIKPDDLLRQLRFLRRRGFRSTSIAEWQSAHRRGSLVGRPILLTFDDAYLDFYETAWPILRKNNFSAHVFVPTQHVGGRAEWDRAYGEPAPLMSWRMIAELAAEGVTFGSHLTSHTRPDFLSSDELLREAVRSRSQLEDVLGVEVDTIAAPFGVTDHRIEQVFAAAGYRQGFLDQGGMASVFGLKMLTPRIEVAAGDDINAFAVKVGMHEQPPGPLDAL